MTHLSRSVLTALTTISLSAVFVLYPFLHDTTRQDGRNETPRGNLVWVQAASYAASSEPDAEKSQGSPPRNDAPLENLPAEIRRYLLFTLNYEELKALINASPIYHQQYWLDRRGLRRSCVERTLGNISADAYAVYQSGMDDFIEACNPKSVAHLMDSYEENLSLSHYSFLTELTMDEIMSMFSFHISIVMPLARSFTTWALNNLASIRMSTLPTLIMVIEDIITRPLRQRRLISIGNVSFASFSLCTP